MIEAISASGQQSADGADDAFAVGGGGLLGVDLERGESRHRGDLGDRVADAQTEDLPDVGGGVGRDEQHLLAGPGQAQRRRARDGGLADPAFTGEEHEPGRVGQERRIGDAMKASTPRRTGIGGQDADLHGQQQVDSPGVQQESLSSASPSMVTPDGAAAGTSRPAQVASSVRVG